MSAVQYNSTIDSEVNVGRAEVMSTSAELSAIKILEYECDLTTLLSTAGVIAPTVDDSVATGGATAASMHNSLDDQTDELGLFQEALKTGWSVPGKLGGQMKTVLHELFEAKTGSDGNDLISEDGTVYLDQNKISDFMSNANDDNHELFTNLFSAEQMRQVLDAVADHGVRVSGDGADPANASYNFTSGDTITARVKIVDQDTESLNGEDSNFDYYLIAITQS